MTVVADASPLIALVEDRFRLTPELYDWLLSEAQEGEPRTSNRQ